MRGIETLMREGKEPARKTPKVIDPDNAVAPEILATAIVALSEAAKKLLDSRLTERALLVLLKDDTGIALETIRRVLHGAADLRKRYVK